MTLASVSAPPTVTFDALISRRRDRPGSRSGRHRCRLVVPLYCLRHLHRYARHRPRSWRMPRSANAVPIVATVFVTSTPAALLNGVPSGRGPMRCRQGSASQLPQFAVSLLCVAIAASLAPISDAARRPRRSCRYATGWSAPAVQLNLQHRVGSAIRRVWRRFIFVYSYRSSTPGDRRQQTDKAMLKGVRNSRRNQIGAYCVLASVIASRNARRRSAAARSARN